MSSFRISLSLFVHTILVLGVASSNPIVSEELQLALESSPATANIFVTLRNGTKHVLHSLSSSARITSREVKLNTVYTTLRDHAAISQAPLVDYLASKDVPYTSFWVSNQIYIENADATLVAELEQEFRHIVSSIEKEGYAHIVTPVEVNKNEHRLEEYPWGIRKIQAPEAWEELGGIQNAGDGVIVATIDTGVRSTHQALKDNFLGDYGWFDPKFRNATPVDHHGHGTHTMGTIVGSHGIGVAPNAKWSTCAGCPSGGCPTSALLACGEFFTCPTLPDGSNPDCTKAPHLVSNSWGLSSPIINANFFDDVIDAWHVAGIIPLFSVGNAGPKCESARYPGTQASVISVGATTYNDERSKFSSAGPTNQLDEIKPEMSAPGSDILSASHYANNVYARASGSSMACPHVAGVVALLKARNKALTYQQVRDILFNSTDQDLKFSGLECGGVTDETFPNHIFGYGRVNALKSVQAQSIV